MFAFFLLRRLLRRRMPPEERRRRFLCMASVYLSIYLALAVLCLILDLSNNSNAYQYPMIICFVYVGIELLLIFFCFCRGHPFMNREDQPLMGNNPGVGNNPGPRPGYFQPPNDYNNDYDRLERNPENNANPYAGVRRNNAPNPFNNNQNNPNDQVIFRQV